MAERSKRNYKEFYETSEVIGMGGYGYVYKGRDIKTKELRAIKVISKEKIEENLLLQYQREEIKEQLKICIEGFIKEFENMKICSNNNDNSVKCYEYFNNEDNFVIIMELCDKNLSQILIRRISEKGKGFNYEEIYDIMKQLNKTFRIMEENKIIHRDLKLENILIKYIDKKKKKYIIKLSDYGCSKRLISLSRNCNTYSGTVLYMSPEILKKEEYNYKCDLWSLGIIIYRLIYGEPPYLGKKETDLIDRIEKLGNTMIKIENEVLNDLVKKLLEKEPKKRINWDEYFNHPFFETKSKEKTNTLNLIYYLEKEEEESIFGEEFVKNNIDKIELVINGTKSKLIQKYKLKKGENNIQIIIKNKIINIKNMFESCRTLKNIDGLKYLDTKEITDFSYIFDECSSLLDIKSLENWDVSKGTNFSFMFRGCSLLSDIKSLENWNVSKGTNFSFMFRGCSSLSDINSLENWNVSNGTNFSYMFRGCSSLSDLKSLDNWDISLGSNFSYMFSECSSLSDIGPLENWNISHGTNFSGMFRGCSSLSDIKSLENWNVSHGSNFSGMFGGCSSLSDIKSLENWNVYNITDFSEMFRECSLLSDIKSLKNWNVSNGTNFSYIFYGCSSLSNIKSLENWKVSNGTNFSGMLYGCSSLSDIESLEKMWNVSLI